MGSWQKQIRLLWWSQLIAISAMEMSEPFWPLFLRQLNSGSQNIQLWSAMIYGAPLMLSGFIAPYWGKLGDRYGHKRMVLRATLGLAVTQALLYFSTTLLEVLIYRLLQGVLAGVITAVLCFACSVSPEQKRAFVVGKLTSATAAGAIIGPLVGGAMIQWFSFSALFLGASLTCFCVALVMAMVLKNDQCQRPLPAMGKGQAPSSAPCKPQIIWLLLLVIFFLQIAKAIPSSFFALYTEQYFSATPLMTGLLFSSAGVGMMISAPYWGKLFDRLTAHKGLQWLSTISLFAACCFFLHLYSNWLGLLLIRFSWGVCLGAMLPMIQATMIDLAKSSGHGLIIGKAQGTIKIGNLAGVSLGAGLFTWWEFAGGFLGSTIIYLMASIILLAVWFQLSKSPLVTAGSRSGSIG